MMTGMKTGVLGLVMLIAVAGIVAGCAHKVPPSPDELMRKELQGAPEWVVKGCNSYWKAEEGKKMICGVGSFSGTSNPTLAREAAIARARTDIAQKLQLNVNYILKDYQATTTGGARFGTDVADEQHIEAISKQVSDANLTGSELVDTWISEIGTYYTLVALDAKKFKDTVSRMGSLSEPMRKAIVERADKLFEELERTSEGK